jgi:predicted Zn-dependent peptidase
MTVVFMKYKKTILPNGIRFIHTPVPSLKSATFTVWYAVGSRYEEEKVAGISHFLEHMAFKGGGKYPTAKAVSEAMDAIGAENNASTSQEYTNYYVRSAVSSLPKAVDVLADTLLSPALKEKEIEKERGVIIEEINMYEDDPKSYVHELYGRIAFPSHPLGRDIAGTRNSVRVIKKKDFVIFRDHYYHSDNVVITVSGGISYKNALAIAEKHFGSLPNPPNPPTPLNPFTQSQAKPNIALKIRKTEQTNLIIGFPGKKHSEPSRYAEGLMGVILGAGMSSRLFREVRERRGLAYSVNASSSHYKDTGEFSAYAGVPVNKAEEAIKVILQEFYKLLSPKSGISKKELIKAKEFLKGHMALSMESTKWINYFFGYEEIKGGQLKNPEQVFEAIDKVTVDEILAVAKDIFKSEKTNLAIIGPYKDKIEFEKILSFRA